MKAAEIEVRNRPKVTDIRLNLIRQFGTSSMSYSALQEGMHAFTEGEAGFVPYFAVRGIKQTPMVLGDPICAPEQRARLLDSFLQLYPEPIFLYLEEATAKLLNDRGFYANEMGSETIIDLESFDLRGSRKEFLRSQRNRARKDGAKVFELGISEVSTDALKEISNRWMKKKSVNSRELKFLARPAVYDDEPDVRKFFATKNGEVIGFVFYDPIYSDGKVTGYMANILRSCAKVSYSITDYINLEAMEIFKKEGLKTLSLGFSPFHNVDDGGHFRYSKPLKLLFQNIFEHGNALYHFKELAFHKERYRPDIPGAHRIKIYGATRSILPAAALFQLFAKMGIINSPFRVQTPELRDNSVFARNVKNVAKSRDSSSKPDQPLTELNPLPAKS